MALGAITFTKDNAVEGDRRYRWGTIQATSGANYTVGGEPLTAALFRLGVLEHVQIGNVVGAKLVEWDKAAGKLKVYTALGTEALVNTDQSTVIVPFLVIGNN